jgi:hypothetical protein
MPESALMTKFSASDLEGALLDWAVAKAEGIEISGLHIRSHSNYPDMPIGVFVHIRECVYDPSRNRRRGKMVVDREGIDLRAAGEWHTPGWEAKHPGSEVVMQHHEGYVAAMRSYVAFKLGAQLEIPSDFVAQVRAAEQDLASRVSSPSAAPF